MREFLEYLEALEGSGSIVIERTDSMKPGFRLTHASFRRNEE
jgi:hypothetical protein